MTGIPKVLLLVIAASVAIAACPNARADVADLRAACGIATDEKSAASVIAGCTDLINSEQVDGHDLVQAHVRRGTAYAWASQRQAALADFNIALAREPDNDVALFNRGRILTELEQYDAAIRDFDKALLVQEDEATFGERGVAYLDSGQYALAIPDFDRALQFNPSSVLALGNRGHAYAGLGQQDKAMANYTAALKLQPDLEWVLLLRGRSFASMGNDEQALADYQAASKLNPNDPYIYPNRDISYIRLGRTADAIADCDAELKLFPNNASALYLRGMAKRKAGDGPGGDADIAAATAISPKIADKFSGERLTP